MQFIGYISLLTVGVGGVTRAALYKPLAENDIVKISGIVRATEIFMRKVALAFTGILVAIAVFYPLMVSSEFDWFFIFTLALILGIGRFAQYFFGITYQMLLTADQRGYIPTMAQICAVILNLAVAVTLILTGSEIRIVMLASGAVFVLNRIFIQIYVKKRYELIKHVEPDNSAIKQRWDAFAHQVANFVQSNTDILLLTAFTGIMEVSVYSVYYLVIQNIKTVIIGLMGPGIPAAFGNMLAKNEDQTIQKNLRLYEFLSNSLAALFFSCTAMLIVPFVTVYTKGIVDVDYYRPVFAYIACASQFFFVVRTPYQALVLAAGHYRQTRNGAIMEAVINLIISVLLVNRYGLVGVAVGSLCAMMFRTVQYAVYMSKHVVKRSSWISVRRLLLTVLNVGVIVAVVQILPTMAENTYTAWILYALPVFGVSAGVTVLIALIFYREEFLLFFDKMRSLTHIRKQRS